MRFLPKCRVGPLLAAILFSVASATPAHDEFSDQEIETLRTTHWAFQLPTSQPTPEVPASFGHDIVAVWSQTRIDRFLAQGIATAGLTPSPPARPQHVIRRLFYDLTGLPPSAEEVDAAR
jgi:hypothetical protein